MPNPEEVAKEVAVAASRIGSHVRRTPVDRSAWLSALGGAEVSCKLENLQHTGAFKVRGALNKMLSLSSEQLSRGVVTASTGNHGAAVAFGANKTGASGIVYMPGGTPAAKVEAIEALGAEVRFAGTDCVDAEGAARAFGEAEGVTYISPYNDPLVVAGQGTIAFELAEQLDRIDVVLVALGGGGLISGIAAYLKSVRPAVRVVGCSPANSKVMIDSVRAGRILDLPSLPTLSEGTAGGVEGGAITFDLCSALVDEFVTVTEEEIADSLCLFMKYHHMLIEGAAAVPLAAYTKARSRWPGQSVAIIICGANIPLETLKKILNR